MSLNKVQSEIQKLFNISFFFLIKKKKKSFVAGMELNELPKANSFKLNKLAFCLHDPLKV